MDDSNVPIFAQAMLEYTKQIVDVLYMNMYDGVRSIYDDSKQLYARKATTSIIYVFRSLLEKGGLIDKKPRPAEVVGKAKQEAERKKAAKESKKENIKDKEVPVVEEAPLKEVSEA